MKTSSDREDETFEMYLQSNIEPHYDDNCLQLELPFPERDD